MDNIFSLLKESSDKYPNKIYVVDKEIEFTYYGIYQKVRELATHIDSCAFVEKDLDISERNRIYRESGYSFEGNEYKGEVERHAINSGDRILIYLDNSVEYITAFFAAVLLNAIVVPINKNTTVDNLQFILQDTLPKAILSNTMFLKRIQDKVDFGACQLVNMDGLIDGYGDRGSSNSNDNNYSITNNNDGYGYKGFISNANIKSNLGREDKLTSASDLPAMILYTSGTTRMPKGVTLTHKNLIANTDAILEYLELTSEDSILATINFSYSYGNSVFLTHTKAGGTILIENRSAYPVKVIDAMYQSKATGFSTVGSYINLLLKQENLKPSHLKYLRYITFAGESTSTQDLIRLSNVAPHIKLYVMYGQTEAAARLSYLEPARIFEKAGSIGKGISGVTLKVVKDDGSEVGPGELGEIIAQGENIMKGYWNNETETKTVIKQRWLYTGDLATVDQDGYIYVKGRKDDMIKYLGHRISPLEIEAVINSCEQVLEAAVVGIGRDYEKQIKAYIVPKYSINETDQIDDHIRRNLPAFKRPQLIEFVEKIPRTVNGKIKRSELRSLNANEACIEESKCAE